MFENDIAFFMEYAPKRNENENESPLEVWRHALIKNIYIYIERERLVYSVK